LAIKYYGCVCFGNNTWPLF